MEQAIRAQWNKREDFTEEADKRAARFQKHFESYKEARAWLNEQFGIELRNRNFFKALYEVTGATDGNNLIEMELDADQMIQLLQNYDFEQFNTPEGEQSKSDSTKS